MTLIKQMEKVFGTMANPIKGVPTPIKTGRLGKGQLIALRLDQNVEGVYGVFTSYHGAKQIQEINQIRKIGTNAFNGNFYQSMQHADFLIANNFISRKETDEEPIKSLLPPGWHSGYWHDFIYILSPREVPKL